METGKRLSLVPRWFSSVGTQAKLVAVLLVPNSVAAFKDRSEGKSSQTIEFGQFSKLSAFVEGETA